MERLHFPLGSCWSKDRLQSPCSDLCAVWKGESCREKLLARLTKVGFICAHGQFPAQGPQDLFPVAPHSSSAG